MLESLPEVASRGKKHKKEIRDRNVAHPIVIHFGEEHQGVLQPIILRVLSNHRTA